MSYPTVPVPLTDQRRGAARAVSTTNSWIWAILTIGYLLPWAIAASRGKRSSGGIFWLNLLAGWTVIGWVAALVMAAGDHGATWLPATIVVAAPPGGPVPPLVELPAPSAASAPCASCRYPLWFVPAQGWIHQTTRSVWCDPAMTRQAQPVRS